MWGQGHQRDNGLLREARSPRQERSAWLVSFLVHLGVLLVFSLLTTQVSRHLPSLILTTPPPEEIVLEETLPEEFHFEPVTRDEIGSSALGGLADSQLAGELLKADPTVVPSLELEPQQTGQLEAREFIEATSGPEADLNYVVRGAAGVGVEGAEGAIDRITQEVLGSLEQRDTLVVWFFDRSGSLQTQREAILKRFDRVYEELGVIDATNVIPRRGVSEPLLTSVISFGKTIQVETKKPTADFDQIRAAVDAIELDDSGVELVFSALHTAAMRFRSMRNRNERNVLFIVFTDEAGDDQEGLDQTVDLLRRLAIPVYVVGVPAPFGRKETLVKWVDPDPRFDQTPQWGRVDQGPESLLPERIQLQFAGIREDETPIDSGFGPFALTRLCAETGGIYFTVHPNRATGRRISRGETDTYSAHFAAFFDPQIMRRYQPEYVSANEYLDRTKRMGTRAALLRAAEQTALNPLETPRRRFVVRSEAALAADLTEAQKDAARLEPAFRQLYDILSTGVEDRPREIVPRWQAGFDLAMGRVLANKVRAESYNAMLAQAKRGMKFQSPENNTWVLVPDREISVGSRLARDAEAAREYLQRVVDDHPETPWALLASRELNQPLGWKWEEQRTELDPPRNQVAANNNNNNPVPQDDQLRRIAPPPKRRPPPKL